MECDGDDAGDFPPQVTAPKSVPAVSFVHFYTRKGFTYDI